MATTTSPALAPLAQPVHQPGDVATLEQVGLRDYDSLRRVV
jgi:hypothetical protein